MRAPRRCPLIVFVLFSSVLACHKKTSSEAAPLASVDASSSSPDSSSSPVSGTFQAPTAEEAAQLAVGSNAFAFDLWARMRNAPGNLAVSPASISIAIAMMYGGARGDTANEMMKVMHFGSEPESVMASWGRLSHQLTDASRPMKLRLANRLFGEATYDFKQEYLDKTRAAFDAGLEPVDFKGAPDAARSRINGWVDVNTEHRIPDLLPVGSINAKTRLVLVNTIYFLARWETPFGSAYAQAFSLSATKKKDVQMMHMETSAARLTKGDAVTVLELPYQGGSASMLVVLPDKVDGLADLERSVSAATLASWTKALAPLTVRVSLPRFKLTPPGLKLGGELRALGMDKPFNPALADFTSIGTAKGEVRLHIDDVIHQAFVKVDEAGTEAVAATAVAGGGGSAAAPRVLPEFVADHPFLFFILDKASDLVLFMGRVAEP